MDNRNDLESKIFKRAESHIQAKLKPTFLKTYPHYIVPGLNLNKLSSLEDETSENIMGLYQDFPFSCDLPRPLLPPAKLPRTVINGDDPATELLALKAQIKEDLDQLVDYCNKYKKIFGVLPKSTIDTKKFGKNAKIKLPRYIADIAELIEHDPDPYFAGKYNWYYTGGTLSSINIGGQPILLFPYLEELVASPIIPRSDILWKPVLSNAAKCSIESVLFEIRNSVVNNLCRIIGRHKNSLNIYRLTESKDRLSMIEIHNMRSKLPYIGADISSFNINEYCTITVERQLALWDLTKVKCINNDKTEESLDLTDAWGILNYHFLDPNVILYTDRCCLRYFDKRTTFSKSVLSMCPKQNLEQCEKISFQASSRHGSCQYIGTYHSFLMCDDRSANQCVQQKWTHQFKSAPLLASIFNRNEQEIIVTSSQLTDENSIIVNTWTGGESAHSFSLPISPPNILDTLNLCQMDGTCLDLRMRVRLGLSNVGSTLIMNNDGYVFFFIQNSIGDIFYQCITHENVISNECEENYKARYALSAWEKAFVSQNPTIVPLCMSEKYNVKHIFDSLTNKELKPQQMVNKPHYDYEPSWKQPVEKLQSHIDILAPELLAAWEITEDMKVPETAPHQKVLNWLGNTEEVELPEIQSQPFLSQLESDLPFGTQELKSVSQEQDLTLVDDSNVLQELLLPRVKTELFYRLTYVLIINKNYTVFNIVYSTELTRFRFVNISI